MFAIRSFFLIVLFAASWTVAYPVEEIYKLVYERADGGLEVRQQAMIEPVTFQTVTTTQTQAGTITQTCTITLSPITAQDGSTAILSEKDCNFEISQGAGNGNGGGNNSSESGGQTTSSVETTTTATDTFTQTTTSTTQTFAATDVPAISEIGVGTIPATQTAAPTDTSSSPPAATETSPLAVSVIGTNQVPNTATGSVSPAESTSTATEPVTVVTTLADGSVSTSVSTPSAAAAQEAAATTPGRKLEVLPIGLGVFAGVSVIALIVVGLVTYERTKYRKAFRQRKLAEAGANMGYGGMAERT